MYQPRTRRQTVMALWLSLAMLLITVKVVDPVRPLAITTKLPAKQNQRSFGQLPISFQANRGQFDPAIQYCARGNRYNLLLTSASAMLLFNQADVDQMLQIRPIGGNLNAQLVGLNQLSGGSNYFIGDQRERWVTDLPAYHSVGYRNIYPGIDLIYYGNQQELEYDLVVAAGADPALIRLDYQGADRIWLDPTGNLIIATAAGQIIQHQPIIYQQLAGVRAQIAGNYLISADQTVSFQIADYDHTQPLIIDPVISYASYLGGSDLDRGAGISVDAAGNLYLIGTTRSINFPATNALRNASGGEDVFITKLDPSGSEMIYSTYLGGNGNDEGFAITVDQDGNAYLTGSTSSQNFPTVNAQQAAYAGGTSDIFIAKLNPTGNQLIYSSYLGGSNFDEAFSIAVDNKDNAYLTGETGSQDLPLINPVQASIGGQSDTFVIKLSAAGDQILYSTYLGGNVEDIGTGIVVDDQGSAYICGATESINFPLTPGAFQTDGEVEAFVVKLNPTGDRLIYSTFIGGDDEDGADGIAIDGAGNAYVTGFTSSEDFPTVNPVQAELHGDKDAFIAKLNADGSSLIYSTYLGGSSNDQAFAITVDQSGNAAITGQTSSADFPVIQPVQAQIGGGVFDAFVVKLNASGDALQYASYLGGAGSESGIDIKADRAGNLYLIGSTDSNNFPTANSLQSAAGGDGDAFIVKLSDQAVSGDFVINLTPATQTITAGAATSFTIAIQPSGGFNQAVNLNALVNPADNGISANLSTPIITPGNSATVTINTKPTVMANSFTITITASSGQLVKRANATLVVDSAPDFSLSLTPNQIEVKRGESGEITVNIDRVGGFSGNVNVIAPNTKPLKIKLTPAMQSSQGNSVKFSFKIKKAAAVGNQLLQFVGKDETGRTRTATINLMIK